MLEKTQEQVTLGRKEHVAGIGRARDSTHGAASPVIEVAKHLPEARPPRLALLTQILNALLLALTYGTPLPVASMLPLSLCLAPRWRAVLDALYLRDGAAGECAAWVEWICKRRSPWDEA